ncbi:MAG TPA: hypothetical protein [Caudoviricetes sp.]|jgi:hypothetical protein|nr:MAG TPA: hypothetical protein [Caudoviricetes sp.]
MKNKLKQFFCAPERWENDYYNRIDGWRLRMAIISALCAILIIGGLVCIAVFNVEMLQYIVGGLAILSITVTLSYFIYSVIVGGK